MPPVGELKTLVNLEWCVKKFSDTLIQMKLIQSEKISVYGTNFYLRIYRITDNLCRICLINDSSNSHASSNLDHNELYSSCYIRYAESSTSPTVPEWISLNSLFAIPSSQLTVGLFEMKFDSTLTIKLNVFKDKDYVARESFSPKPESTLIQNLEDLFLSEREADVLIKVKGFHFKSHRSILAARSEVFAAMFRQDMAEKQSSEVEIKDCDPKCFKNFLLYLYTEKSDLITANNALGLYYIADKYAIDELKKCCAHSIMDNLCVGSICDILVFATMYDESNLLQAATNFFCENSEKIIPTTQWADFQKSHLALSNGLLLKCFMDLKVKSK